MVEMFQSSTEILFFFPKKKTLPFFFSRITGLNDEFFENWLNGFGKHLTRVKNALLRVTFSQNQWRIEFVNDDGLFENEVRVSLEPLEASVEPVTAYFASKDFVPAIRSLSLLPITEAASKEVWDNDDPDDDDEDEFEDEGFAHGARLTEFIPEEAANYKGAVELELDEHMLRIRFCTSVFGGSQHTIYVPTTNPIGERHTQPFMRYFPQVTIDTSPEESVLIEEDLMGDPL